MHISWRARLYRFYARNRRTFWILHSVWALVTGLVVVILAHRSYGYAAWVLGFLVVTWVSTLFFSRRAVTESVDRAPRVRFGSDLVSYVTRVMYQETLFFLLPFYYYSTTLDSANVLFLALLLALAVVACLDLVFDELLRRWRWFGLAFFALVSFAALDFLLPLVLGLRLEMATPLAAGVGFLSALPLAYRPRELVRPRPLLGLAAAISLLAALLVWGRWLIPPVPLQLEKVVFAASVDRSSLEPIDPLGRVAERSRLPGRQLAVIATVSAPRRLESSVEIQWERAGRRLESSRELTISPHEVGFRIWDTLTSEVGPLEAGRYRIEVRTTTGQLIGRGDLVLRDE